MLVYSILLVLIFPWLVIYLIWALEIYALIRPMRLLAALGWGMFAFTAALFIQTLMSTSTLFTVQEIYLLSAPVLEEVLKALGLLYLMRRLMLWYGVDGLAYGALIGSGFATAENIFYISMQPNTALGVAAARIASAGLMHIVTSALIGVAVGDSLSLEGTGRKRRVINGLLTASGLHAIYNIMALVLTGLSMVAATTGLGVVGLVVILGIMRRANRKEAHNIASILYKELSDGEMQAAIRPDEVSRALMKHRPFLDARRAQRVDHFVRLQAQRGILKQRMIGAQSERYRHAITHQITEIEHQLASIRAEMGLYTSIWMRSLVSSSDSKMLEQMAIDSSRNESLLTLLSELDRRGHDLSPIEHEHRLSLLTNSALLAGTDEEEIHDLAVLLNPVIMTTGDILIHEGEITENLYWIDSGSLVSSTLLDGGAETIINAYSDGDTVGEMSMIDLKPHPFTVSCVSDVRMYALARRDFVPLLYAKPHLALVMMGQFAEQIRQQNKIMLWVQQTMSTAAAEPIYMSH